MAKKFGIIEAKMLSVLLTLSLMYSDPPVVRIMPRVDTTHPQVRAVLGQWVDSLVTWRRTESPADANVYAGTRSVVQNWFSQSDRITQLFPPTVLSVEVDSTGWVVRTIFASLDKREASIAPLGIVATHFESRTLTNGSTAWFARDAMADYIRAWDTTSIGVFRYVHQPNRPIDRARAEERERESAAIAERFGCAMPPEIWVYSFPDRDELARALGVEYHAFPPQAVSFPASGLILETGDGVARLHEIVHVLFRQYPAAHPVLREGLATYLGGTGNLQYQDALSLYIDEHEATSVPSFVDLFVSQEVDESDTYILGALLCDMVLKSHGKKALLELLELKSQSDVMIRLIALLGFDIADRQGSLFQLAQAALDRSLRTR